MTPRWQGKPRRWRRGWPAPAGALAGIKTLFGAVATNTLHQQLDLEASLQGDAGRSADFAEGVRAFQEKRPPRFGG